MSQFDIAKESYFKELEERVNLDSQLNLPLTIITLIGGWVYYCATSFDYGFSLASTIWFLVLGGVTTLFLLSAVTIFINTYCAPFDFLSRFFYFIISIFRRKNFISRPQKSYRLIPFPSELGEYYREQMLLHNNDKEAAMNEYEQLLIKKYDLCTEGNKASNKRTRKQIDRCKSFLGFAMVFGITIIIPFTYNYSYANKLDYQQVKIIDSVKIFHSHER